MIALLCAIAIGQVDVAELRERYEIAESLFNDELSRYAKSCREQYEAIQREPDEARKRELSEELEAYKREMSPLLSGGRWVIVSVVFYRYCRSFRAASRFVATS
ncbi:MAG: hypothetical protein H8E66_33855 [Planctomycetes bacterium]|nr:hypothetical protein [Planctomycetota bacterium]